MRLDFAPLEELAMRTAPPSRRYGKHTIKSTCEFHGIHLRQWHRWKKEGTIHFVSADKVALKLGVHPIEIWGADAWGA